MGAGHPAILKKNGEFSQFSENGLYPLPPRKTHRISIYFLTFLKVFKIQLRFIRKVYLQKILETGEKKTLGELYCKTFALKMKFFNARMIRRIALKSAWKHEKNKLRHQVDS